MAAPTLNKITIAAIAPNNMGVDNELYIFAVRADGKGTSEICHLRGSYLHPVNFTINMQGLLEVGYAYKLIMVGINWGGPASFNVVLDPPTVQPQPKPYYVANDRIGVVWNPDGIDFTAP